MKKERPPPAGVIYPISQGREQTPIDRQLKLTNILKN